MNLSPEIERSFENLNSGYWMVNRSCDNPAPAFGGLICNGTTSEFQNCLVNLCPDEEENSSKLGSDSPNILFRSFQRGIHWGVVNFNNCLTRRGLPEWLKAISKLV